MRKEYSLRTLVFIDILGFKNLIKISKAEDIAEILDDMQTDLVNKGKKDIYSFLKSFELAYFSDSIVMSCDNSEDYGFIETVLDLQIRLMRKGIFIRGCITKGELYHQGNIIFGPGIIAAYTEESQIAKYPRIIQGKDYSYIGTYYCKDYDGVYFIDPFRRMQNREWNEEFNLDSAVKEIIFQVDKNIKEYSEHRDVSMKYSWLKQIINEVYYNENDEYKYFWPSYSTYDRNETHRKLRDTLLKIRKENELKDMQE